jgi:hypothetical protein
MSLIHLAALLDSTFKAQAKDVLWNLSMYVFLKTDIHATSPAFNPTNYLFTLILYALRVSCKPVQQQLFI